jgi:hypothetical protein
MCLLWQLAFLSNGGSGPRMGEYAAILAAGVRFLPFLQISPENTLTEML